MLQRTLSFSWSEISWTVKQTEKSPGSKEKRCVNMSSAGPHPGLSRVGRTLGSAGALSQQTAGDEQELLGTPLPLFVLPFLLWAHFEAGGKSALIYTVLLPKLAFYIEQVFGVVRFAFVIFFSSPTLAFAKDTIMETQ